MQLLPLHPLDSWERTLLMNNHCPAGKGDRSSAGLGKDWEGGRVRWEEKAIVLEVRGDRLLPWGEGTTSWLKLSSYL